MTIITKGMGVISKNIYSKLVKNKTKSKTEQILDNVYKKDPTGKKDIHIKNLNEKIKKSVTGKAGQKDIDAYHRIMTSDRQYKPGKK